VATTVLIVDDDPGFRRVARELLAAAGMTVVADAADGAEALRAIERLCPDAVLLDVHLPDTDGFSLARSLRDGGRGPRVLLTSSDVSVGMWGDPADYGAVGLVPKTELVQTDLARYLAA
jgi:CheY-like chemotaxis protein